MAEFFNSCVTHEYPCTVGEKIIDPCMCGKFYLCEPATSFIHWNCSAGTLFNHENSTCDHEKNLAVIDKLCVVDEPWNRCLKVDPHANISYLRGRCTPIPSPTPGGPQAQTGDNTGAIVGGVIAVLLIIAIIVVLVILYKKRGKPVGHHLSFLTLKKPVENRQFDNQDENYTEINDVMRDPVYNDSTKMKSDVNQDSNKFKGRPGAEEVAYDNAGYTLSQS